MIPKVLSNFFSSMGVFKNLLQAVLFCFFYAFTHNSATFSLYLIFCFYLLATILLSLPTSFFVFIVTVLANFSYCFAHLNNALEVFSSFFGDFSYSFGIFC